jgi:hypothetical protein
MTSPYHIIVETMGEELGGAAIAGGVDFSANGVSLEKQEQR